MRSRSVRYDLSALKLLRPDCGLPPRSLALAMGFSTTVPFAKLGDRDILGGVTPPHHAKSWAVSGLRMAPDGLRCNAPAHHAGPCGDPKGCRGA